MAEAKSLFMRHWKAFEQLACTPGNMDQRAMIWAACIVAEAIRNEQDSADLTVPSEIKVV